MQQLSRQLCSSMLMCKITSLLVLSLVSVNSNASTQIKDTAISDGKADHSLSDAASSEVVLDLSSLPSISAVLRKYNESNPDMVITNWVQLSPSGMKVHDVESKSEIIKNFDLQRVWLSNSKNKTKYEIDVDFYREYFPTQVQYLIGPESLSNISGLTPCAEYIGKMNGKRVWRGQIVEEWDCQIDDGTVASTQLFSDRWKLVVQVRHADKRVEELVDIKQEKLISGTFIPNNTFRQVEITEFMTGRVLLDSYSP